MAKPAVTIFDKFHVYKCQKPATLWAGFSRDAKHIGAPRDQFIEVVEKRSMTTARTGCGCG